MGRVITPLDYTWHRYIWDRFIDHDIIIKVWLVLIHFSKHWNVTVRNIKSAPLLVSPWKNGYLEFLHDRYWISPWIKSIYIIQVVLFLTIFTSEMVNTKSTQMVDIMSADAQATQLAWASATVILMIVKVVLLLSVLILDSENALPTSMVNTLSADFIDLSMFNIDII